MQSDSAEIKPAQCCIKLVFHLTYTMMHGKTKLKFSGNVILPVFFDHHYRCVPAQRHTPLCRSQLHTHGVPNANGCRRHAHRTKSNISLPHSSPINFPRNPSFINITPTPTPIITFYGPTQVPHYNTAWYGRGVVHITPQSHYRLLHKYRPQTMPSEYNQLAPGQRHSATPKLSSMSYNLSIYYRVHNSPHSHSILILYSHILSCLLSRTATSHHVATVRPRVAVKPIFFQLPNVLQHREEFLNYRMKKKIVNGYRG